MVDILSETKNMVFYMVISDTQMELLLFYVTFNVQLINVQLIIEVLCAPFYEAIELLNLTYGNQQSLRSMCNLLLR